MGMTCIVLSITIIMLLSGNVEIGTANSQSDQRICYSYDLDYKNCKNSTNEIIDRIRSKINVNPYKLKTFIGC